MAADRNLASVDSIWHSVSLEERLELISRAHATGVMASIASFLFVGSIAYGFDQIWMLLAGLASSVFVFPLFSSYCWRRGKPALILAYLAVRAVGRRYAYGYNVDDLDIILIFRGQMREMFPSREAAELAKQSIASEFDDGVDEVKEIWIMLLRGAVVLLSEKTGGAKLEFLTHISPETVLREASRTESHHPNSVVIEGVGVSKGRTVLVMSKYPGAQYVFRRQLENLIEEQKAWQESQERLRQKTAA